MRKEKFVVGEYYHIYNRGVDKRDIFKDNIDLSRFWKSMHYFNRINSIGSIYEFSRLKERDKINKNPLVDFIAYCINPNHYHFLLTPLVDQGIEKFMQRLGNGYTKYFNVKNKRNGVLFQGKFKSKHIDSNDYLMHLSVYINTNNQFGHRMSKLSKSSIKEYLESTEKGFCNTDIIIEQFKKPKDYEVFLNEALEDINLRKQMKKELEDF